MCALCARKLPTEFTEKRMPKKATTALTKRTVKAAKGPEVKSPADLKRSKWYGDAEVPGFGLRVYGSGAKVFALRYRTPSGRSRTLRLGEFGELTVQQARDKARKAKVRVLDGLDPQAEKRKKAVGVSTVGKLLTRWIDDYARAHRKRWKEDKQRIDRHLRPKLGRLHLTDLTPDVLASWHRRLGEDTPTEANRALETLRAAWRWGHREGVIELDLPEDPTRHVKKFRERSRDRWLKPAELKRLMAKTAEVSDPYVRAAIPLFLLTGLRRRELLGAEWKDMDLERGEIRLPSTKTGEPQVRILPEPAVDILRALPRMEESPYVFPSPKDPQKPRDGLKKPWRSIRDNAKLADITLHDLRRTAGSYMAQAGVPLQVIGQVLGHSHPGVTKVYARLASENEREALGKLSEALSEPLGFAARPKQGALQNQLRELMEATDGDVEALAAGLERLGLVRNVKA